MPDLRGPVGSVVLSQNGHLPHLTLGGFKMEIVILLLWCVFAAVSATVAGRKGYNPGLWLVLGFLFGLVAVIVVAVLPDKSGGTRAER